MIADKELCQLFKIESEERLLHLDNGLLRLEQTPDDRALIEALFREAHSLKGAARMLGLIDIQTLAHQIEDTLGELRKGDARLSPEAGAEMGRILMEIRRLVRVAIGEAAADPPVAEAGAVATPAPASPETFRIETMRVDPQRLDALLTQVGELTVTQIRVARRQTELDELLEYCEDWARAAHGGRDRCGRPVAQRLDDLQKRLTRLRAGGQEDSTRLDFIADRLEGGIRALRLLPMSTLFALFPRLVRDLAREQGKEVELLIEGGDTVADKHVLEEMKDPLMHMLRNAVDHGIESPEQRERAGKPRAGRILVRAGQSHAGIVIEVIDDGRGLDLDRIKRTALEQGRHRGDELDTMSEAQLRALILMPGFSTRASVSDVSGRGVGLDVLREHVERLKGNLDIESAPGLGLTLRARLPVTLATVRVLIVAAAGQRYALPVEHVLHSRGLPPGMPYTLEGRPTVSLDGQALSVASLRTLLDLPAPDAGASAREEATASICVVLGMGEERFGLLVDALCDETEVVLKPQSRLLKRVRNVAGATILETGEVCMVLNPHDLLKTLRQRPAHALPTAAAEAPARKTVLLAEDSITTRTQEKRILEGAGYEVVTAVDGADAYGKLIARDFDAVVSDITMPNMSGLELTRKIRADKRHAELPIILVTTLASEEDRHRGLEAGANAYIAKPAFDQQVLLECLARLV